MNHFVMNSHRRLRKTTLHNISSLLSNYRLTLDNRQLCEWFLSHGADPNAQCNYDITPLSHGVTYASREIIELLFQHGGLIEKGQLLHNAVHREKPDCLEIIQMLLNKGCDINAMKYKNHKHSYDYYKILQGLGTPLHDAAERGHPGVVKFLLANGADPLVRDTMNELPIDRAKRGRHTEVVDFLRHYSEPSA